MNKLLYTSIFLAIFSSCSTPAGEEKKEELNAAEKIAFDTDTMGAPILNGEFVKKYDNGIIQMKGDYRKGKRNGMWQSWYPNGTLWSETVFKMGVKEGATVTYYEDGMLRYNGFYKNDQRAGKWKLFDETGKLQKEIDYAKEQK